MSPFRHTLRQRWPFMPLLLALLFALAGLFPASAQIVEVGNGGPGPVKAEHLTAELTAQRTEISAGGSLEAGLVLTLEDGWHVYWVNAGDSGEPPSIRWTLPAGVHASGLQFPAPIRLPYGPLMDFGYEGVATYPFRLTADSTLRPGKVHLDAKVSWLVCAAQCVPGKAHLGLDVTVLPAGAGPGSAETPAVGALGEALKQVPVPLPAGMDVSIAGDAKNLGITVHTGQRETFAELYPFDSLEVYDAGAQLVEPLPDGVRLLVPRDENAPALPKTFHALLKLKDGRNYDFTAPVHPGAVAPLQAGAARGTAGEVSGITFFGELGLAFLGGLVLNLMPCVFPVLFLKGLGLVHSSGEEKRRQRLHGLIYTLGILVSFWAVVGLLLVLRAGGKQVGWGFQMQSPGFVAVLASLVFFLALSLAGQFEIGLSLTSAGGGLAQKQGFAGSFFTGVLAVVVATPCMGPLLGAAVGFALSQTVALTFLIFTALALGLALPYLLLTLQPQWTSLLPKPGAWMETLKQLTAVPLFATAVWLAWVYGQLFSSGGVDHMASLLFCFLVLAVAGWVLGRWPARWTSALSAGVLILLALAIPLRPVSAQTEAWQPWSPDSFATARASGKPVFVDFTAAWCLSCKVNEAAVLRSGDIERKLAKGHFQLLKADWTQYDPRITAQLSSVNRSGVPTYVIYPAGKDSNADVLPELLTKEIVSQAIEKDLLLGTARSFR